MTPYLQDTDFTLYQGDALEVLAELPSGSVHCCVTSPPYWGLRDYGTGLWTGGDPACDHKREVRPHAAGCVGCGVPMEDATEGCRWCADRHLKRKIHGTPEGRNYREPAPTKVHGEQAVEAITAYRDVCGKCGATRVDQQLGLEQTPDQYVTRMVEVFREIRRVLRDDGTCWLNLGDSYYSDTATQGRNEALSPDSYGLKRDGRKHRNLSQVETAGSVSYRRTGAGLKPKDLVGIPWRVAFALQQDGWWLRSDIIWAKPNPMPESVTDRPTKAHEYIFMLTKSARYYFDQEAVRERYSEDPVTVARNGRADFSAVGAADLHGSGWNQSGQGGYKAKGPDGRRQTTVQAGDGSIQHRDGERWPNGGRNIRSVWDIPTQPYAQAHFATFPLELPRRCIAAGCPPDGVVLDPFLGAGTTALVARNLGRRSIGIELSPQYCALAADRLAQQSLLATEGAA